jgi:hypothetical protein
MTAEHDEHASPLMVALRTGIDIFGRLFDD